MESANILPHVIIFPLMTLGHTLPLLDLAMVLSRRDIRVTIITTPSNVEQISLAVAAYFPKISIQVIPFPVVDGLPQGLENVKDLSSQNHLRSFLRALLLLKEPFECCLREIVEKDGNPICLVSNYFLGRWTVPICSSFKIPVLLCYTFGVLSTALCNFVCLDEKWIKRLSDEEKFETFHGLTSPFSLSINDFPELKDESNPFTKFIRENGDGGSSKNCWGVLCNSFEELEGEFVRFLESSCGSSVKAWCVGPLFLYNREEDKSSFDHDQVLNSSTSKDFKRLYQSWLDEKLLQKQNVIYIAFGSQSHLSDMQLDEIALGLDMAGHHFIWIISSTSWTPPHRWEERVKQKGLIIREWVNQRSILEHPAIGGFLSHCGWNSILESLSFGVPILAWPLGAEQPLNAKFVMHVLKVGIAIEPKHNEAKRENVTYGCDAISTGVKELMGGERGQFAREKAKEIGRITRKVVEKDGSSSKNLDKLIKCLVELSQIKKEH